MVQVPVFHVTVLRLEDELDSLRLRVGKDINFGDAWGAVRRGGYHGGPIHMRALKHLEESLYVGLYLGKNGWSSLEC